MCPLKVSLYHKASEDARPHLRPNQGECKYIDGHQRG